MRNFNHKHHHKPSTQNSFRKSDRKYPQTKKLITGAQSNMQIERDQSKGKLNNYQLKQKQNNSIVSQISNFVIPQHQGNINQKYLLNLQSLYPINDRKSMTQQFDQTCLWFRNISTYDGTRRKLCIKQAQYTISDWANDQYQQTYCLTVDSICGYLNQNGITTNKVAILKLLPPQAIQRNGTWVYDLVYELKKQIQWDIPKDLTHIKLGLVDSNGNQVIGPLNEPLFVELQIRNQK